MAKLTLINETMDIKAGMTLYHQCPVRGMRAVKVARTTKTLIIFEDGGRYNRKGYATGDTWKRNVLFIEVKAVAASTQQQIPQFSGNFKIIYLAEEKLYSLQKAIEYMATRNIFPVVDNEPAAEIKVETAAPETNKATTVKPMQSEAQLSYSVIRNHEIMVIDAYPQHLDKERIEQVHAKVVAKEDVLLTWAGFPLASDPEERQRLIKTAMGLPSDFKAQETIKTTTSTNDIQQCMQRKREKEALENALYAHKRALSYYSLVELKELAKEQGLDIRGRSKAVYVNALVGKRRLALMNA